MTRGEGVRSTPMRRGTAVQHARGRGARLVVRGRPERLGFPRARRPHHLVALRAHSGLPLRDAPGSPRLPASVPGFAPPGRDRTSRRPQQGCRHLQSRWSGRERGAHPSPDGVVRARRRPRRVHAGQFRRERDGSSEPLLCGPSVAAAASAVAGTEATTRVFAHLERSCHSAYPALLPTVTTTTSARDMNQLRVALGPRRINFYGVSYGTVLGSVYRQLFPSHVRSMVLDGAVDPNLSLTRDATLEAPAIETALQHDLRQCVATAGCPLGSASGHLLPRSRPEAGTAPLPAPGGGDTTPVTEGDLTTATLLYLSVPGLTPGYLPALASAAGGNGAPLRSVAVTLESDLNGQSLVGPLWAFTCNDAGAHPNGTTTACSPARSPRGPVRGAEAVANYLIACPGWTGSQEAVAHLHPNSAPTPLVVGNTGDPNTPYAAARPHLGHRWAARDLRLRRTQLVAQRIDERLHAEGGRRLPGERCSPCSWNPMRRLTLRTTPRRGRDGASCSCLRRCRLWTWAPDWHSVTVRYAGTRRGQGPPRPPTERSPWAWALPGAGRHIRRGHHRGRGRGRWCSRPPPQALMPNRTRPRSQSSDSASPRTAPRCSNWSSATTAPRRTRRRWKLSSPPSRRISPLTAAPKPGATAVSGNSPSPAT